MDLVNIVYRYVNRLINSDELINLMENLDKEKFSEDEVADITELLDNIKKLKQVPGRLQKIDFKQNYDIILDYAHTTNATY